MLGGKKSPTTTGSVIGLFLLAVVLFNYPILSLFNLEFLIFGFPLLYLYLFLVWAVIILFVYLQSG
jgi:hypothetical protein